MPHIEMTVGHAARRRGVEVDDTEPNTWRVAAGPIGRSVTGTIEPDLSNATPFLAAAAVTGGAVTVAGWPATTTQAGRRHPGRCSPRWAATVILDERGLTVTGAGTLSGVDVDLHDIGELTPTIAALAVFARRPVAAARHRAPARPRDRPARRAGRRDPGDRRRRRGDRGRPDRAPPAPLHGGAWRAYADHRMATAGAIIGLVVPGVEVDDIATARQDAARLPRYVAQNAGRGVHNGGCRRVSGLVSAERQRLASAGRVRRADPARQGNPARAASAGRTTRTPSTAMVIGVDRGRWTCALRRATRTRSWWPCGPGNSAAPRSSSATRSTSSAT